jgi:flagellar basal-body rod protein FlgG
MPTSALHVARTGLEAQDARMRVIANNLANIGTTGYQARPRQFCDAGLSGQRGSPGSRARTKRNMPPGLNLGTGVSVQSTTSITTQGTLSTTGNALDFALDGDGYFPGPAARRQAGLYPRGQFHPLGRGPAGHRAGLSGPARDRDSRRMPPQSPWAPTAPFRSPPRPVPTPTELGQITVASLRQFGGPAGAGRQLPRRNRRQRARADRRARRWAARINASRACSKPPTSTWSRSWST